VEVRKYVTITEEVLTEGGKKLNKPITKVAALAVVKNPHAGKYQESLQELIDIGGELGEILTKMATDVLGTENVESFGKGAIVGENGEIEHGAAMNHVKFGNSMRKILGGGKAVVPSTVTRGAMGATLNVPVIYKDATLVRSHFDAMEIRLGDAPKADEIIVAAVLTNGGRPLPRLGGLKKEEIEGKDGLK
jgi:hypothetical protein